MPKPKTRDHDLSIRWLRRKALDCYDNAEAEKKSSALPEWYRARLIMSGAAFNMAAEALAAIQGPIENARKKAKQARG